MVGPPCQFTRWLTWPPSHAVSQVAGHDVSHPAGHAVSLPVNSPVSSDASHARSPARKPASKPVRIGDAIVHPDIDGLPVPTPTAFACGFVEFLLGHTDLQDQRGGWISTGALKRRYYPQFGATIGKWPLLPWRTVAVELGYLLEKRDRQTRRLMRKGKLRRLTVSEYRIPEAQKEDH